MTDKPDPASKGAHLDERQKAIAFEEATEPPFSHPLNDEKRSGAYYCAVCRKKLFSSDDKFDSGSGWPSFTQPAEGDALGSKVDRKLLAARTEVHCANCGAHMGHVFDDGPGPTGKRYCINGAVLDFKPETEPQQDR